MDSCEPTYVQISQNGIETSAVVKTMSPVVLTDNCVNCGTCIEHCPTGAIYELQRQICRLCPDCAQSPVMFPRDMEALTSTSCAAACPIGHYPEGYINLMALGQFEKAWRLIASTNPLPSILGRICSRPCEDICKRGTLIDAPLPIRALKRLASDIAYENGWTLTDKAYPHIYDETIAVIGAGPAGFSAAHMLASKGYSVDIFDSSPKPGGMLRKTVPSFRLPENIISRDFDAITGSGIRVHTNTEIGKNPSIRQLLEKDFDAVLIATGAPCGVKLDIPGADYMNVYNAVQFMTSVKAGYPVNVGEKALVIGGGSVATDTARTLLRLGALDVTLACAEGQCDMPALSWELEEAMEEGVSVLDSAIPVRIGGDWQKVQWVDMDPVSSYSCGPQGIQCETDETKRFRIDVDTLIFAVGQKPDLDIFAGTPEIQIKDGTKIVFDPDTNMTSMPGVFLAGDIMGAKGSVLEAVASAKKTSNAIDAYLRGRPVSVSKAQSPIGAPLEEKIFPVRLEKLDVAGIPTLVPECAVDSFDEVEATMDIDQAMQDARRCMKCGYVDIKHEQCIGCGMCAKLCPKGDVIRMESPKSNSEQGSEVRS